VAISHPRRRVTSYAHKLPSVPGGGQEADRGNDFTWRAVVDSLASRVALLDENGRIVAVNASWRRYARPSDKRDDYAGWNYLSICDAVPDATVRTVAAGLRRVASGELDIFETVYPCESDAGRLWWLLRVVPYERGDGGDSGNGGDGGDSGNGRWVIVAHHDVTEARRDRERAHQQAAVLNKLDAAVYTTDLDRIVLTWNAGAERLFGWTPEEAIGRPTTELTLAAVGPLDPRVLRAVERGRWNGEVELGRKDGSTVPVHLRAAPSKNLEGETVSLSFIAIDISERLQTQRELTAARDHLRAVAQSIGEGMFTLDLDGRLTYMNPAAEQVLGWKFEDIQGSVIQELVQSRHLEASIRPLGGEVVRVPDDVFLLADGTELPVAYTAAPVVTADHIDGIVVVFRDITERKAEARRLEREIEKVNWVRRIQRALADDRFVLFAQPILELGDDEVVQRELLIRMRDPDDPEKLIAPGAFLPVAEEYGLIGEIDRWVIDQATRLAADGLAVELNVSAASIGDRRLIPYIQSAIRSTGADPAMLVFEITETALVGNEQDGRDFVERMHGMGCRVALDDFGTGYGGFTYLKQLPVDYLKIDMEFVRDLTTNIASRNVVEAIVTLAQRFGLKTVAEGVEDGDILSLLFELGVDYAQGYHIGRPAPLEATTQR
jgi:PAS domain S-box-containing protein